MVYSHLASHYQITYSNQKEDAFLLHNNKNNIIKFIRGKCEMF